MPTKFKTKTTGRIPTNVETPISKKAGKLRRNGPNKRKAINAKVWTDPSEPSIESSITPSLPTKMKPRDKRKWKKLS